MSDLFTSCTTRAQSVQWSHSMLNTEHQPRKRPHLLKALLGRIQAWVQNATRSSAQGNCSAKSLAASVMSSILPCLSILPCPPCLPPVILSAGGHPAVGGSGCGGCLGRGEGVGGGEGGGGRGHFHLPAIHLHYHMVLRPKGTSYNDGPRSRSRAGKRWIHGQI